MNKRGQSLIETAPFFFILATLLVTLTGFTQWFLIHQKLVLGARYAALLYSSHRMDQGPTTFRTKAYLAKGFPAIDPQFITVGIGKYKTKHAMDQAKAWSLNLYHIRIRYRTQNHFLRWYEPIMEETCVIKRSEYF